MSHIPIASRVDVAKVRAMLKEDDLTSWDDVWYVQYLIQVATHSPTILSRKAKVIPWDGGGSQPPLREVIESGEIDFPRQGRALVPGCGSVCRLRWLGA
jgi:hypothetical protein